MVWNGAVLDGEIVQEVVKEGGWVKFFVISSDNNYLWVPLIWTADTLCKWVHYFFTWSIWHLVILPVGRFEGKGGVVSLSRDQMRGA